MDRRTLIKTVAAAGVGVAVAGCNQGSGGDDGDEVDEDEAEGHIEAAAELHVENTEAFASFSGEVTGSGDTPDTFDAAAVTDRVDEASDELDDAEEVATDEQAETIESLRAMGDAQGEAAAMFGGFATMTATFDEVDSDVDRDDWESVAGSLDGMESVEADAASALEAYRRAIEDVDADALEGLEASLDDLTAAVDPVAQRFETFAVYLDGFRPLVDGIIAFQEGADRLDTEEYGASAEAFATAEARFGESNRVYTENDFEGEYVPDISGDLAAIRCQTAALRDAADYFERAALALRDGDQQTANDLADRATQRLEECDGNL
jgi:hypothetical protein